MRAQHHGHDTSRHRQPWLLSGLLMASPAMAIDLDALWDFSKPALSEERFRAALPTASGDDALILQTQIARTWGLRRDFERARDILADVEPRLAQAGPEARVRYWLELGRTHASATHTQQQLTPQAMAQAREAYARALEIARAARLDALAIDVIHMMAFVDTAPADQLRWGQQALDVALASQQPAARNWEAALRNNIGFALHQMGRNEEALAEFQRALAARERQGKPRGIRIAQWMIAMTLRRLDRLDEAREIQLRLEREWDAAGEPDPYVFEELEKLYRAQNNTERADHYAVRLKATRTP
jgi:tetratricopeptide (TPR) repeat protein